MYLMLYKIIKYYIFNKTSLLVLNKKIMLNTDLSFTLHNLKISDELYQLYPLEDSSLLEKINLSFNLSLNTESKYNNEFLLRVFGFPLRVNRILYNTKK